MACGATPRRRSDGERSAKNSNWTSAAVRHAHHLHQVDDGKRSPVAEAPSDNAAGCYKRRDCAKCGRRFPTTPKRRLLCRGCFRNAAVSGFDPGDGEGVGDLQTMPWRP